MQLQWLVPTQLGGLHETPPGSKYMQVVLQLWARSLTGPGGDGLTAPSSPLTFVALCELPSRTALSSPPLSLVSVTTPRPLSISVRSSPGVKKSNAGTGSLPTRSETMPSSGFPAAGTKPVSQLFVAIVWLSRCHASCTVCWPRMQG